MKVGGAQGGLIPTIRQAIQEAADGEYQRAQEVLNRVSRTLLGEPSHIASFARVERVDASTDLEAWAQLDSNPELHAHLVAASLCEGQPVPPSVCDMGLQWLIMHDFLLASTLLEVLLKRGDSLEATSPLAQLLQGLLADRLPASLPALLGEQRFRILFAHRLHHLLDRAGQGSPVDWRRELTWAAVELDGGGRCARAGTSLDPDLWSAARRQLPLPQWTAGRLRALAELGAVAAESPSMMRIAKGILVESDADLERVALHIAQPLADEALLVDLPALATDRSGQELFFGAVALTDPMGAFAIWLRHQVVGHSACSKQTLMEIVSKTTLHRELIQRQPGIGLNSLHRIMSLAGFNCDQLNAVRLAFLEMIFLNDQRCAPLLWMLGRVVDSAVRCGVITLHQLKPWEEADASWLAIHAHCGTTGSFHGLPLRVYSDPVMQRLAQMQLASLLRDERGIQGLNPMRWVDVLLLSPHMFDGPAAECLSSAQSDLKEAFKNLRFEANAEGTLLPTVTSLNATIQRVLEIEASLPTPEDKMAHAFIYQWLAIALFTNRNDISWQTERQLQELKGPGMEILAAQYANWRRLDSTAAGRNFVLRNLIPHAIGVGAISSCEQYVRLDALDGVSSCFNVLIHAVDLRQPQHEPILDFQLRTQAFVLQAEQRAALVRQMERIRWDSVDSLSEKERLEGVLLKLLGVVLIAGVTCGEGHPAWTATMHMQEALSTCRGLQGRLLSDSLSPLFCDGVLAARLSDDEEQVALLGRVFEALQATQQGRTATFPASGPLSNAQVRLLSFLCRHLGMSSWMRCAPWLAQSLNEIEQETCPAYEHRPLLRSLLHSKIRLQNGTTTRLLELLDATVESPLLTAFFLDESVKPEARLAMGGWLLEYGALQTTACRQQWIASLGSSSEATRARMQATALAVAVGSTAFARDAVPTQETHPCLSCEDLVELRRITDSLLSREQNDLCDILGERAQGALVERRLLALTQFLADVCRHDPLPADLWTRDCELAFWLWVYRAGQAENVEGLQTVFHLIDPHAPARAHGVDFLRVFQDPVTKFALKAFQRGDFQGYVRIPFVFEKNRHLCEHSEVGIRGLIATLSAFPYEWWLNQRALTSGLAVAEVLSSLSGRVNRLLLDPSLVLMTIMARDPRCATLLATALNEISMFHLTPMLMLRATATEGLPPIEWHEEPWAPAWFLESFEASLQNPQIPFTWFQAARSYTWQWSSLYIEPCRQLNPLPDTWTSCAPHMQAAQAFDQWTRCVQGLPEEATLATAWAGFQRLLEDPSTPRLVDDGPRFKAKWLGRLYAIAPVGPGEPAAACANAARALICGLLDLEQATCGAGWDQVLSAVEESLGGGTTLEQLLKMRLGTVLRQTMVERLGAAIGTRGDAHLKNKSKAACHLYPTTRSIGGLSMEALEEAWTDRYALQDHPHRVPRLVSRLDEAPEPAVGETHPASDVYDRRVIFMIRREMPRLLNSCARLSELSTYLLDLPAESDSPDLRNVAQRGACWLTSKEEDQYRLYSSSVSHLREAQRSNQADSPVMHRIALALGCAIGLFKVRRDPLPDEVD